MRETRRQACLQALGLTPWVARSPLPGAPASPRLEPAPEPQPQAASAPEQRAAAPEPVEEAAPAPDPAPEPGAGPATGSETGLRFTLYALATPALLLVMEQSDPAAPEPGRDEQALLASLLRYFNAREAQPRTFAWPLPGADPQAEQARASLEAFTGRLCSDARLPRVLWLLDSALAQTLLGQARFQSFGWRDLDCLAVSSLAEMLADPVGHKRATWQAMVRHGFTL
jgi:hypothetical protein